MRNIEDRSATTWVTVNDEDVEVTIEGQVEVGEPSYTRGRWEDCYRGSDDALVGDPYIEDEHGNVIVFDSLSRRDQERVEEALINA